MEPQKDEKSQKVTALVGAVLSLMVASESNAAANPTPEQEVPQTTSSSTSAPVEAFRTNQEETSDLLKSLDIIEAKNVEVGVSAGPATFRFSWF